MGLNNTYPGSGAGASAAGGSAFPWGAVAAGASGLIDNLFNIGARERQHKRNIEVWNMQNDYNHPSAQMARLREAGLNPNMLYGQGVSGATGQSSSAPEATTRTPPPKIAEAFSRYQNVRTTELQNDNLRAQNTAIVNQGLLSAAQAVKTAIEGKRQGVGLDRDNQSLSQIIEQLQIKTSDMRIANEAAKQKADQTSFTPEQNRIIREANYQNQITKFLQNRENLNATQKLNAIREIRRDLEEKASKYYDANAIMKIVGPIITILKAL